MTHLYLEKWENFWKNQGILSVKKSGNPEGTQANGAIPFLDILVTPQADNSLSITVYCKPTHTDQYLQWDSHHSLPAKYSIIGTLTHMAKTVCTSPKLLQNDLTHLRNAMGKCNYCSGPLTKYKTKFSIATGRNKATINMEQTTVNHKPTTIKMQAQPLEA